MQLKATARTILSQILDLTAQLNNAEYTSELDILSGNTIGKHVRHILEFYGILVEGHTGKVINYDQRKHEPLFETDTDVTQKQINTILTHINEMDLDREVNLEVSYSNSDQDTVTIKSNLQRELAYNIEHSIHHMAIIKIAIQTVFPNVQVAENFGVAYSTVRYQKSVKS